MIHIIKTGSVIKTFADLWIMAELGQIHGVTAGHRFGYHPSTTISPTTIWDEGILYPRQAAASPMTISSTSANDVDTAGTGAWMVLIKGTDEDSVSIEETVSLNGLTPVALTNEYLNIHSATVIPPAGTISQNDGDIYIGNGTVTAGKPAVVYAKIAEGNNQTLMCVAHIPHGFTMLIGQWFADVGQGVECTIDVVAALHDKTANPVFQVKKRHMLYQGGLTMSQALPFAFPEDHFLEMRVKSDTPGVTVSAGFDFVLFDNKELELT